MERIKTYCLYVVGFYVVYSPELFLRFGVPSQVIIGFIGMLMLVSLFLKKILAKRVSPFLSREVQVVFLCILLNAAYLLLISMQNGYQNRFLQNVYIIIQIFTWTYLLNRYHIRLNNKYSLFQNAILFLANLAMIQAVFCIIMLILPSTKQIALQLYYLGREENIFISGMRIYGISGDYTFFTPIYHGLLGVCLLWLSMIKNSKYLLYLPFIFLVIILNGRTGLVIFFIGAVMMLLLLLINNPNYIGKSLLYLLIIGSFTWASLMVIKIASPNTYQWFMLMVGDIANLFGDNVKTGNIAALSNSFVLPSGFDLIFGLGTRVIGGTASNILLPRSDIGYINDIYLGGLIYIVLQYGSILLYTLSNLNKRNDFISVNDKASFDLRRLDLLPFTLFVLVLIGNYKGELMRSGIPLVFLVVVKNLIIMSERRKHFGERA
ncbi:hypothetical protein UAS_01610 [Enterococcus asini ATCC 700915]|uniref:Uncharacterized protein n=1 Tax=Enterococcus asini ATCC 700915 TaxID=1158606 RepID=R2PST1_9ENTE|nr:hypothetical protein [Enterococcus asini]EOH86358.1 hypothetical protein UAS_01610 [Enterococcus asini ATCC 700915]EOT57929.1 hypothetical protein I579_01489 [Enterococcus asini ATCC 700915]OJG08957.1 hypothetical protein RU94_GL001567 [Enterococcus asini]